MEHDRPSPPRPGPATDGRFEILGVLGEGGTGVVYDARMTRDDGERVPVALKVIHDHLAGDRQVRSRFAREARILSRLEGPHLCPILAHGELPPREPGTPSSLFLALRRIEGEALDDRLRVRGTLAADEAVAIARSVCDALGSAHAQGVIHRDLKPANVLLAPDGGLYVVDFGMAKIVTGAGSDATALTQRNMVFGTPEYMAPEQARGDALDSRCDVYALGVLLYEMLAGEPPFRAPSALGVLTAHLAQPPTPLRALAAAAGCSAALEAVVAHALAKRPDERYPTASDLSRALAAALAHPDDVDAVRPSSAVPDAVQADDLALARTMPASEPTPPALLRPEAAVARPPRRPPVAAPPVPVSAPARRPAGATALWALAVVVGLGLGILAALRFS